MRISEVWVSADSCYWCTTDILIMTEPALSKSLLPKYVKYHKVWWWHDLRSFLVINAPYMVHPYYLYGGSEYELFVDKEHKIPHRKPLILHYMRWNKNFYVIKLTPHPSEVVTPSLYQIRRGFKDLKNKTKPTILISMLLLFSCDLLYQALKLDTHTHTQ